MGTCSYELDDADELGREFVVWRGNASLLELWKSPFDAGSAGYGHALVEACRYQAFQARTFSRGDRRCRLDTAGDDPALVAAVGTCELARAWPKRGPPPRQVDDLGSV